MSRRLLIPPCGGSLVDLLVPEEEHSDFKQFASRLPSLQLSDRAVCDLELLASGGFSPLSQFMSSRDYQRVLAEMRLADGHLFPIPVTLSIESRPGIAGWKDVALRNAKNDLLAIMTIEEVYEWNLVETANQVFRTQDLRHPLVAEMHGWGKLNLSGRLRVLQLPPHPDFRSLRLTPTQTRERLASLGKRDVVAFQTRNPLHRAHEELTKRAVTALDGVLFLHPVVGMTKPGDVDHYTRVRTYKVMADRYYRPGSTLLALLPLAMRLAGPREAVWHALIRRNFGANHLIVGRDHASPGSDSTGRPFYGPYDAQQLVEAHQAELGVGVIPFEELVYLPNEDRYEQVTRTVGTKTLSISGTQVREDYLNVGRRLPEWFTRREVGEILAEAHPPRHREGLCV